ncbi:MAG: amidohydrolase family protein [Cellulomonadaceae bacterium]
MPPAPGTDAAPRDLHLHGHVQLDEDTVLEDAWVLDGRLCLAPPPAGTGTTRIDGWAMPGLVDVHCHVGLDADGPTSPETARRQALADRDSGVLLIRDAGSPADTAWVHTRPELPRLIRAGAHLARPKRYLRHYGLELEQVAELPDEVARQAARGDGWVKLVADWIDRTEGAAADLRPLWPDDVLVRAIAAAHAGGARVTAHAFSTEAVDGLLDAGVDCLEHGTGLSPEQIDRVVRAGISVTPTLLQIGQFEAIARQADGRYPVYAAHMRAMHARRYTQVRTLFEAGVRLLVGTDAGGTIAHGRVADECAELVRAGVPAPDVVAAASWATRAYLGVPPPAPGQVPDLVVYPADPRADIRVLAQPAAVILRGRIVAGSLAE